ncbi:hypothetical protein [Brevundimonas sp.]|uniref:hypothetical protein n=1 Tax=Brevundimonas sp. TaxID=1871086 RepID=UPI001ACCA7AA|nr:hypothetical protein [Brevundimonas sp.]MBN9467097.1 hypothetical protein [Brevundimonas sp.]
MTDVQDTITFKRIGDGPIYEKAQIWLPQLIAEAMSGGSSLVENKTFVDCRIEGPAVLLAMGGCDFDACDMGWTGGDIRNLLLAPVGPEKVIGAVGFRNCVFQRCKFFAVGFTGAPEFLKNFQNVLGKESA